MDEDHQILEDGQRTAVYFSVPADSGSDGHDHDRVDFPERAGLHRYGPDRGDAAGAAPCAGGIGQ